MPSQSVKVASNPQHAKSTRFQAQYHEIKFGRIKKQDKLKFCPIENLISFTKEDAEVVDQSECHHLPWTPVNSVEWLKQKVAAAQSQSSSTLHNQRPSPKYRNNTSNQKSNTASLPIPAASLSTTTGPVAASKPAAPTTWSALLKSSSSGPNDASNQSSAASTPSLPTKKKRGANGPNHTTTKDTTQTSISHPPSSVGSSQKQAQAAHIEKWRIVNTTQKGPPIVPRGLINNGNSCFMNSILQPLLHTPPFYLFLMGLQQRGGIFPPPNVETPVLDSMLAFVKEFRNSTDLPDPVQDAAFSCDYVFNALRKNKARDLLKGQQEDAQEFLGFLLDAIHEELLATIDRPSVEPESGEPWTEVGKKNKLVSSQTTEIHPTQITRIFSGMYRFTLHTSNNESISTEHFNEHFISIPNDDDSIKKLVLEEMMRDMCKAESVHVGEQGQIGTKVEQFERLPPIFMIGLKRFHSEDGRFFKVERHIEIPHWLDVPRECLSNLALATIQGSTTNTTKDKEGTLGTKSYQLYAVIQHHGKSIQGGHYTTDILHQSGQWLRFDDSAVSPIDASIVTGHHKDRQPYILFYIEKN